MPRRKAKSLSQMYHRVQMTTPSLPAAIDLETFLDELSAALHKSRALPGLATSADLLLRRVYITCTLDHQRTVDEATNTAIRAFHAACRDLPSIDGFGIDIAELLVERLRDEDEEDRQALLGTPEVAERLGVSRERVRQWAAEPGRFPVPVARTRDTNVWRWGDVADWLELGGRRRTGRPRKVDLETQTLFGAFNVAHTPAEKVRILRQLISRANANDEVAASCLRMLNKAAVRFNERAKRFELGEYSIGVEGQIEPETELVMPKIYTRALPGAGRSDAKSA